MSHTVDLRNKNKVKLVSKEETLLLGSEKRQNKQVQTKKVISWRAPSFYYNPQKRYLALVVSALLVGAATLVFFQKDTLMAIFLILSSLVLILYANKRPEINDVVIDDTGVHLGEHSYFFHELKSFWIEYAPNRDKELSLEFKKWYLPFIKISLEDRNPIEIRSWLISFIPEREHEHSLMDFIGKKLGL